MANFCRRVGDQQAWSWCFGCFVVNVDGSIDRMLIRCMPASALDNWRLDIRYIPIALVSEISLVEADLQER